jgi:superfamily I DNA/RNA helicase
MTRRSVPTVDIEKDKSMATYSTKGKKARRHTKDRPPSQETATGESYTISGASRAAPAPSASNERAWSEEQKAIFAACSSGNGHLVVSAYAGTGKTTTIIEATKYLSGDILLCAFNKRIAEELQRRLDAQPGPKVHAKTLHSLGFSFLQRAGGRQNVDADRLDKLIRKVYQQNQKNISYDARLAARKLITLVKETIGGKYTKTDIEAVDVGFGCSDLLNDREREVLMELSPEILLECARLDGSCDFSDMLWLPLVHNMVTPSYDVVIVDEAQDMNQAQLLLARAACRKGGRIIVVGDARQAIYGFRGASSDSLSRLQKELNAKVLKLTTTYRCGKEIVKQANVFVPDFQAHPQNPSGHTRILGTDKLPLDARPGDFILSRANAPLMGICLSLVRQGKRAKVEGKEIGKGLLGILNKLGARHVTEVATLVNDWAGRLSQRLDPEKDSARLEQINDQADVLAVLAEEATDLDHMKRLIDDLFADTGGAHDTVVCSTVHKAKGLEAKRVYLLEETFRARKGNTLKGEEANIRYVALTRAIDELVFVVKKEKREDPKDEDERDSILEDAGLFHP